MSIKSHDFVLASTAKIRITNKIRKIQLQLVKYLTTLSSSAADL